jgi:putative membrane protein
MAGGQDWKAALPASQWFLLTSLLAAVGAANIAQPYPELAPLQHIPTVLLIAVTPWLLRRWPLPTRPVALLWMFLLLHTLGGRYIYSNVPYESWFASVTGRALSDMAGAQRNGYDRLVHFMFGLLCTAPFAQMARRHGGLGRRAAWLLAFALIGLVSALYEVFEWLLTIILAGDTADYYNGQQGDIWDPQKDMAVAQLGSLIACLLAYLRRRRQNPV